jgi:methylmalonyl-CoA/ethylmalonyl-CoA epimerase
MVIDHIGIVVKKMQDSIQHWEKVFGYKQKTEILENTRQKVRVVFLEKENSLDVKLIEPVDQSSPAYMLAKRGGGLHHLCFKCDDMNIDIARLKETGCRVLAKPQPGEAFENEDIAFLYAKQGLNIELIDTDKKANLINVR